jgi:hypothetical protein
VIKKTAFKGGDFAKIEKLNEKELRMKLGIMTGGEMMGEMDTDGNKSSVPSSDWKLIPIDLPDTIVRPEVRSIEREIQRLREQTTLAVLVFKKYLPDSPSEPNEADLTPDPSLDLKTRLIPLEDTNESSSSSQPPSPLSTPANIIPPSVVVPPTVVAQPVETAPIVEPSIGSPTSATAAAIAATLLPKVDHILNITNKILPTASAAQSLKTILDAIKLQPVSKPANETNESVVAKKDSPTYEGLFIPLIY